MQVAELVSQYRLEAGGLPCRLGPAAAPPTEQGRDCSNSSRPHNRYSHKRRRDVVELEEMLIVNRDS